jgi:hypothetical protein
VLQNRQLMKQTFPLLFDRVKVKPVDDYCGNLLDSLEFLLEDRAHQPNVALLTPGMYNSAYFEHSFLAQQMGVTLVEGRPMLLELRHQGLRVTIFQLSERPAEKVDIGVNDSGGLNGGLRSQGLCCQELTRKGQSRARNRGSLEKTASIDGIHISTRL